jgi:hypothetical protein
MACAIHGPASECGPTCSGYLNSAVNTAPDTPAERQAEHEHEQPIHADVDMPPLDDHRAGDAVAPEGERGTWYVLDLSAGTVVCACANEGDAQGMLKHWVEREPTHGYALAGETRFIAAQPSDASDVR